MKVRRVVNKDRFINAEIVEFFFLFLRQMRYHHTFPTQEAYPCFLDYSKTGNKCTDIVLKPLDKNREVNSNLYRDSV